MKNKKPILAITIILSFVFSTLFAQENSISPIFALSQNNTSTPNTLNSVNQITGNFVEIENFSTENLVGSNFTVSTLESSNVDKIYFLNSNNNFSVYDIPYFFDPNYNGEQNEIIVSSNVSDFDYHHQSTLIYSYDISNQQLNTIIPFSGDVQSSTNIAFDVSNINFSLKTTNDFVILSGTENNVLKILIHKISNGNNTVINLSTYKNIKITSNHNLNSVFAIATDHLDNNVLLKINPATETIEEIGNLPSCSDCATEVFAYDKNALSLDWENNTLLSVLKQTENSFDAYFLLTIDLEDGNIINFASLANKTSNLYYNKASADLVFPGDANHDGVVNLLDIFSIGLKYTYNTTARFTQGNQWIGQHAFNTGIIRQGADIKHADCNGDGQINEVDIDAIKENYTFTHNSNKSTSAGSSDCDYPLAISQSSTAKEGTDFQINIKLGEILDTVTDVYAVNFTLNYNNTFVVPNTMHTEALDSWFGIDGGNFIRADVDNYTNGEMEITISGTNLMNRSGGGDIITAAWTMEDHVVPSMDISSDMIFNISDITIINFNEDTLDACAIDTFITVFHKDAVAISTIDNQLIEIYPNPATTIINIISEATIEKIELISTSGKLVVSKSFNSESIDVSKLNKGVYFLKLYSNGFSYLEKLIIQ